jgi:hypothetical protein
MNLLRDFRLTAYAKDSPAFVGATTAGAFWAF